MEFDNTRVYTAVNAEDLPIGSKCIFADTLGALENAVNDKQSAYVSKLQQTLGKEKMSRFVCGNHSEHLLAYLLKEPEYKRFSSVDKAKEIIDKHGGWVKDKATKEIILVTSYTGKRINERDNEVIFIGSCWYSLNELYRNFVFADDGSPCGELVEE